MPIGRAFSVSAFVGAILAAALIAPQALAAELALKRVLLSTGGVGYFEYEAGIDGDTRLALDVRLDQVDDVLKSIVVYDDQGGVGAVSLPGRAPLEQLFRDLPFSPRDLASPVALLNALQGAEITVEGARRLKGRLVRVEPEVTALPDGAGTVTRHRVTLMTAKGLQQFVLEQAEAVRFADPELQAQVEEALADVAAHRAQDVRTLELEMTGEGSRTVRVAYVVEAPLWKTSYRLVLPEIGGGESGLLQGWAVVENMSGADWEEIELTVVSGNPVTFRQALYTAYYIDRPEVPVEVLGRVLPRPDEGELRARRKGAAAALEKAEAEAYAAAPVVARQFMMALAEAPSEQAIAADAPTPAMARATAAESAEAATQVVFRVPYPVSVASGHSLMVPIVNRQVPVKRFAHYQPATHQTHPLAAARLDNDSGTSLPPGVLTVYERSAETGAVAYLGDARLATLPAGEERLVSFAVDEKTRVSRETESVVSIAGGAISQGVFEFRKIRRQTTVYRLKAPAREGRTVLLDHPRDAVWKLVEPDESDVSLTPDHYRIEVAMEPGSEIAFPVTVERTVVSKLGIASFSLAQFVQFAATGELDTKLREAFERLAGLKRAVERAGRRIAELDRERKEIFDEQKRIRNNLGRVSRDTDLYRRYLKKLDQQEDRLESLGQALETAHAHRLEAQAALHDYIAKLEI